MSTVNPYNPPGAAVGDMQSAAAGDYQQVNAFSAKGRIGRLRYLAYLMVGYLVMVLVAGVAGGVLGMSGGASIAPVLGVLVALPYLVWSVMLLIQRSHDMGWSGWSVLAALIPLVGLLWLFKAGTPGANRYGAPPPPNPTWVKIVGWFFPVVFVIGIVAAIALPAYQGYVMRAKAQQVQQGTQPGQ